MRKGTFSERLEWLDQVSRDPDMRGLPTAVAVQLASRYINSTTGRAWPGHTLLATTLCANRRSIQRAIDALVDAGHLGRELGGTGRRSNRYRMRFRSGVETASHETRSGVDVPEGRSASTERGGLRTALIRGRNSGTNAGKARTCEDTFFSSGSGNEPASPQRSTDHAAQSDEPNSSCPASDKRPRRANSLPGQWCIGAAELDAAQRCAGWNPERAKAEFDHFCSHHKAKGTQARDWQAAWEVWCRNGYKFDQRPGPRGIPRLVVHGLQRWVARQGDPDELE